MRSRAFGLCLGLLWACDADHTASGVGPLAAAPYPGPQFPGAGQSGSSAGIAAGAVALGCDAPLPFGGRPTGNATLTCFYGDDPTVPAATVEWIVEAAAAGDLVHVRLTLNPDFVDNTYGVNAIGWGDGTKDPMGNKAPKDPMGKLPMMAKSAHTFMDLVGSDHAEFKLTDASGKLVLHFKEDYLSQSTSAPSGYATLGIAGGDGKLIDGSASDVVAVSTSLDRNLNACGLGDYTVDSPATDGNYTVNALAPNWDYRVIYDLWVRMSAFGVPGFGAATVDFVHASPSKKGGATVDVTPGECPPSWPPYCQDPDGCCLAVDGACRGNYPPPSKPPTCTGEGCQVVGY